jgi:3-oxoacyl-[acyl-carrier-protein] synthase III
VREPRPIEFSHSRGASALATRPEGPERGLRPVSMASVEMVVPDQVVGNDVIAEAAGVTEQWIVHRTGVHERRWAADGDSVATIATAAGRRALASAEVEAAELDLVLVATVSPDDILPNAAPLVATELGAHRAGAMDVGAACTGFLSALSLATAQVEGSRAENVLVIGADVLSRFVDRADRGTSAIFADGAGAAVVSPANGAGGQIGDIVLRCDGLGGPSIRASHDDKIIRMQGHDTFKAAVQRMSEATLDAVDRAGLTLGEIDLFVYHQANIRILRAVAEKLELDESRVIDCIDRYGNSSSATLPIAMCDARERGMLDRGDNVLLAAFGAGFTWGAGVIEWVA